MRRILMGFAMTACMAVIPTLALAGNQEVADQIAHKLRNSGQMNGYKIGIKCQDGTAWLRGSVTSEEQMNTALKLAFQTPGVTRVVNELSLADTAQPAPEGALREEVVRMSGSNANPLRGTREREPVAQQAQAQPQLQLQKTNLVKRLESMLTGDSAQPAAPAVERVANTYRSAPATQVSAEEIQEMPRQMMQAPMQARPMTTTRVAMQQASPTSAYRGRPLPMYTAAANPSGVAPARYDQPCMPNYAWPSYASYPNYAAVTYPKQYSPTAWPYIGPFYPYPQVPMGWRKVTLQWDDGWWFLDFKDQPASCWQR